MTTSNVIIHYYHMTTLQTSDLVVIVVGLGTIISTWSTGHLQADVLSADVAESMGVSSLRDDRSCNRVQQVVTSLWCLRLNNRTKKTISSVERTIS